MMFHLALADRRYLLQLTLRRFEHTVDDGRVIAIHLPALFFPFGDDGSAPRDIDLDRDGERRLGALRAAVRNFDDDACAGYVRMKSLEPLNALADLGLEGSRAFKVLEGDLQGSFHLFLRFSAVT